NPSHKFLFLRLKCFNNSPMSTKLIFDPEEAKSLKCPFTFFIKLLSGKKTDFKHEPYSAKNLQAIYAKVYDQNTLKTLNLLTADALKKENEKYASQYPKLKPNKDLEDYIDQYVSEYYFKSFRQVFHILSTNEQLLHRIKISENRFHNL